MNKPGKENLTQENWEDLCNYWSDPKVKARCTQNSLNRSTFSMYHNHGSAAFVGLKHEFEMGSLEGNECDRITFHKFTHFKERKGWSNPQAKEKYDAMIQLLENSELEGKRLSHDEVYDKVCGTRSGYIKGLGYGPKPKRNQNSSDAKIKRLEESIQSKNSEMKKLASEVDELKSSMEEQRKMYTSFMECQERLIDLLMSKAT